VEWTECLSKKQSDGYFKLLNNVCQLDSPEFAAVHGQCRHTGRRHAYIGSRYIFNEIKSKMHSIQKAV